MGPGSSTENYPAFASIGMRENLGKNLNQVTCPDRDSNPGHLVSRPDALAVTPQCEHPKTTFTKLEQRSWIKIEVTRGRSAQECFQGLHEAYADAALPYHTVARWVQAFREGRDAIQDNLRTGRPCVEDNTVQLLASLLDPPYSPDMIHAITIFSLK
ncbi:hypothetical protein ANN_09556 [Periplaneta americana]|uniref:Mos1 transposase HTH domain-containing protein n=1 Tax=Periplaneta americana TaxID=6978 RepID=A0ABQ8TLL7_PERAM|nr:hypothetical protein ANN_09556 [Periplaneta americana]